MKKSRKFLGFGLLIAIVAVLSFSLTSNAEPVDINPDCPNGCLAPTEITYCYCYGLIIAKEMEWDEDIDIDDGPDIYLL